MLLSVSPRPALPPELSAVPGAWRAALEQAWCDLSAGLDHLLAQHVAHLFIRDPLTLFEEKIHLDDANESDHFEVSATNVLKNREHDCYFQSC